MLKSSFPFKKIKKNKKKNTKRGLKIEIKQNKDLTKKKLFKN